MIQNIDWQDDSIVKRLYQLQREAYLVEARLINFYDIPPLQETLSEFRNCGESFIGFFEQGELAGAVSYTVDSQELTICRMVVDPNFFRKGIAQNLLAAVENVHPDSKVIYVSTGKDNIPAKSLYLKNGFKLTSDIEVAPNFYMSQFQKKKE
ncbi:GNAT family N-acetyltransferase [Neobacillus dielmonensis]|uniref:GNAT family N-acetyltransferase n=1 Tax=Neobacillus dielmonensis TaxID=1347369 RepID=UPI0005A6A6FC|nr:GNAT family N-acetyltransferase [Neobacillus dielmonensis]